MVNSPEVGEPGYYEATETTESECPVGSEALVDRMMDRRRKFWKNDRCNCDGVIYP